MAATGLTFHHCDGGCKGGPGDVCAARSFGHRLLGASGWPDPHLQGGSAGPDIETGQGTRGRRAYLRVAARDSEPGTTTKALGRDPERAWRRLRENPDYVADWGVSAGPTAREAPPRAFRRQTEADLTAARWNLLAWEDPRHPQWAELFWAGRGDGRGAGRRARGACMGPRAAQAQARGVRGTECTSASAPSSRARRRAPSSRARRRDSNGSRSRAASPGTGARRWCEVSNTSRSASSDDRARRAHEGPVAWKGAQGRLHEEAARADAAHIPFDAVTAEIPPSST